MLKLVVNNIKKTKDHEFDLYIYHKVWSKILPHDYAEDTKTVFKKSGDANVYGKAKKGRIESL